MFIMLNDEVSVEDLLRGIIVVSGNDACVALAEGIAGTEEALNTILDRSVPHARRTWEASVKSYVGSF